MRTPFFSTADRILRLNLAAEKWRGTPWRANSMAVGVGVSCHNLPRALYMESHFAELPNIEGNPISATTSNQMQEFLDARPEFERLRTGDCLSRHTGATADRLWTILEPGDLLGMFIPMDNVGRRVRKSCVNHLGVVLSRHWFIHTLMKKNTDLDHFAIPPWSQIIIAAWRPVESLTEANKGNEDER